MLHKYLSGITVKQMGNSQLQTSRQGTRYCFRNLEFAHFTELIHL